MLTIRKLPANLKTLLSFERSVHQSKAYQYIINGKKLNEDEVLVVSEFYRSLHHQGQIPMYTCTCGIFGCGGFYVDVQHQKRTIVWETEQSATAAYTFSRQNIQQVAADLPHRLKELNQLHIEQGLNAVYEVERFESESGTMAE